MFLPFVSVLCGHIFVFLCEHVFMGNIAYRIVSHYSVGEHFRRKWNDLPSRVIMLQGKHTLENEHLTTWREEVPQGYSWLVSLSHWSIYYSQNMLCNFTVCASSHSCPMKPVNYPTVSGSWQWLSFRALCKLLLEVCPFPFEMLFHLCSGSNLLLALLAALISFSLVYCFAVDVRVCTARS